MSGFFFGEGNLGDAPTLKYHTAEDGKHHPVINVSVRFDQQVPDGGGGYKDAGGYWLPVSYWGKRAEQVAKLLKKGARVTVRGDLYLDVWTDKETGEERQRMKLKADYVGIDPLCIDAVTFKKRSESDEQPPSLGAQSVSTKEEADYDDDIPL